MDKIAEFGRLFLDFLLGLLWLIYVFFAFLFNKIASLFKNIYIPLMPTKTRVFQEDIVTGILLALFLLFLIIVNISAFNLFRKDKIMSKKRQPVSEEDEKRYLRISEKKLLRRCFFGGAIGGYLGMKICRHKTLKPKFNIGVTIMLVLQLLLFSFVIGFLAFWLCLA